MRTPTAHEKQKKAQGVILLHGLARTRRSMARLADFLARRGYEVVNAGYPSRMTCIEVLSGQVMPRALNQCRERGVRRIHLVTHSMGGILVRHYLAGHEVPDLGRVVMLSPPNQGSQVVDRLKNNPLFRWLNGPAGRQLGTDENSMPNRLGPVDYEVGVITGDRSVNLFLSAMIPGPNDGKVSVAHAKLAGMTDFLVVHATHPLIMNNSLVQRQTAFFIENGRFEK